MSVILASLVERLNSLAVRSCYVTERPSHRLFAAVYDTATRPLERRLDRHRAYLARGLEGDVLELGAGTGAMLPYLAETDATVHAVEPDPHMRKRARSRAERLGVALELRSDLAESLSYDEDSFAAVISSLVFCTVDDPADALDEVARVLRSGGELRFLEHIGDDGVTRRVQEVATPVWRHCAGGCNLDRDTVERFDNHPSFETVETERVERLPLTPFVRGRLERV